MLNKLFLILSFFNISAFSAEKISFRKESLIVKGPLTPMGCVSATVTQGNPGYSLGKDLVDVTLDDNLNGVYLEERKTPYGTVKHKITLQRSPQLDFNLSMKIEILLNDKIQRSSTFDFNKKNEMIFPFTTMKTIIGRSEVYCYTSILVITPTQY